MNSLTRDSLESLDLIIAANTQPQNIQDIKKINLCFQQDNQSHKNISFEDISNYQFYGALLPEFYLNDYPSCFQLSPILLKKDQPLNKDILHSILVQKARADSELFLYEDLMNLSPHHHPTKYSIYHGQGEYSIVERFDTPISFDPQKEFFFIRSPNNSTTFENVLYTCDLEEKIAVGEWLIYHKDEQKVILPIDLYTHSEPDDEITRRLIGAKFSYFVTIEDRGGVPHLSLHIGDETNPLANVTDYGEGSREYSAHPDSKLSTRKNYEIPYTDLSSFDITAIDFNNLPYKEISTEPYSLPSQKKSYSLLYTSLPELIKHKRWAFNNVLQTSFIKQYSGLTIKLNQHLIK